MKLTNLKLVTIITEAVLEEQVIRELKSLGAKGYTVVASHGEGSRGMRAGELPGQNIRIETLVGADVAHKIMEHISAHYFKHYAIVCYISDAAVLRGEKYI
ncbi:MAG: transcriptional regulator [Oligoflexia bacterium]|nr:transcriptional regulator [Oligoflexia bacterium]